jgi:hypothetical protein
MTRSTKGRRQGPRPFHRAAGFAAALLLLAAGGCGSGGVGQDGARTPEAGELVGNWTLKHTTLTQAADSVVVHQQELRLREDGTGEGMLSSTLVHQPVFPAQYEASFRWRIESDTLVIDSMELPSYFIAPRNRVALRADTLVLERIATTPFTGDTRFDVEERYRPPRVEEGP